MGPGKGRKQSLVPAGTEGMNIPVELHEFMINGVLFDPSPIFLNQSTVE